MNESHVHFSGRLEGDEADTELDAYAERSFYFSTPIWALPTPRMTQRSKHVSKAAHRYFAYRENLTDRVARLMREFSLPEPFFPESATLQLHATATRPDFKRDGRRLKGKGDADNFGKGVADAMQHRKVNNGGFVSVVPGLLFHDDEAAWTMTGSKRLGVPRLTFRVYLAD